MSRLFSVITAMLFTCMAYSYDDIYFGEVVRYMERTADCGFIARGWTRVYARTTSSEKITATVQVIDFNGCSGCPKTVVSVTGSSSAAYADTQFKSAHGVLVTWTPYNADISTTHTGTRGSCYIGLSTFHSTEYSVPNCCRLRQKNPS